SDISGPIEGYAPPTPAGGSPMTGPRDCGCGPGTRAPASVRARAASARAVLTIRLEIQNRRLTSSTSSTSSASPAGRMLTISGRSPTSVRSRGDGFDDGGTPQRGQGPTG